MSRQELEKWLNKYVDIQKNKSLEDFEVVSVSQISGVQILRDAPFVAYMLNQDITWEKSNENYYKASFEYCGTKFFSFLTYNEMRGVQNAIYG